MTITISKSLSFPDDFKERYNEIRWSKLPLYGEPEDIHYIRNTIAIEPIAGDYNDIDLLRFTYLITEISETQIKIKFTYENRMEPGQFGPPFDRIKMTLNIEKYTDTDGLSVGRNLELTAWMPR